MVKKEKAPIWFCRIGVGASPVTGCLGLANKAAAFREAEAVDHGRSPVSSEGSDTVAFSCSKLPLLQVRLATGCRNWQSETHL